MVTDREKRVMDKELGYSARMASNKGLQHGTSDATDRLSKGAGKREAAEIARMLAGQREISKRRRKSAGKKSTKR